MKKTLFKAATCSSFNASWADIHFLYQHQWIDCEEVKKYGDACFKVDSNPLLSRLLWAENSTFDFEEALKGLSDPGIPHFKRIALIGFHDIWKAKKSFKETQSLIEELYSDCQYPEVIASFISYMPAAKEGDFFLEENYEQKMQEFIENIQQHNN